MRGEGEWREGRARREGGGREGVGKKGGREEEGRELLLSTGNTPYHCSVGHHS